MTTEQLKNDVSKWIMDWVSVHNEQLGTVPCPYAKQALLNDKIEFVFAETDLVLKQLCEFDAIFGLKNEVQVIGMNKDAITPKDLAAYVKDVNIKLLMPAGYVALEDHPDDEELINGVKMNQGTWALVMIQSLEKINNASKILESQGYYKNWTREDLDDVVTWRFKK